jgi:16S rRNA (guanine(966)-N(2))-methyltransferase RsmD
MRVIAGSYKGRRLQPPAGLDVRPTSDRVREALFSILSPYIHRARLLDLYAGTGAVGLEALSRGADGVVFVEQKRSSLRLLRENLKRCHNPPEAIVISCDVCQVFSHSEFLKWAPYDIVFADPPYHNGEMAPILSMIGSRVPLTLKGMVILEHRSNTDLPQQIENLRQVRQARYGDTTLTFFEPICSSYSHADRHLSRDI